MARELEGKVAAVTGAASGIGLASTEAMLAAGSRVMVDRDEATLKALCNKHGDAVIPLVIDLLDPKDCATLLPSVLKKTGQLDILHANAGTYIGGDLVDADTGDIDRMLGQPGRGRLRRWRELQRVTRAQSSPGLWQRPTSLRGRAPVAADRWRHPAANAVRALPQHDLA
jgi:NADP-dependent 3-hydroxy acid dehydrogenase YdfG